MITEISNYTTSDNKYFNIWNNRCSKFEMNNTTIRTFSRKENGEKMIFLPKQGQGRLVSLIFPL